MCATLARNTKNLAANVLELKKILNLCHLKGHNPYSRVELHNVINIRNRILIYKFITLLEF